MQNTSLSDSGTPPDAPAPLEHSHSEFNFTLDLPFDAAAPLFGGWGERAWLPGWEPRFLHPVPPCDQDGAVFTVDYGGHTLVFMTTVFDLAAGRFQHVILLADSIATKLDIQLARRENNETEVFVVCERTALAPAANQEVMACRTKDALEGERWQRLIHAYWASRRRN